MKNTRIPPQLEAAREEIEQIARAYGLDFFPILYEVLDYRTLYETAAFGGFPTRYPHWRFGMDFDQLLKGHIWAGATIYEMVINTNPSYAYLLEGNEDVTQKMVMAHVTGHVDFFKHNMWFAHTNRKMLDAMANHATRIQRIIDRIGYDLVEDFIDTCLSLENLIDYHSPYIRRPEAQTQKPVVNGEVPEPVEGLKVEREYMRGYINPPEYLEAQRKKQEAERAKQRRFPENPQKDILLFLLNYAPLEHWQHTILEIVRDEAYYFAPQGMTKIVNEGWACVSAKALLFTQHGLVNIADIVEGKRTVPVSDGVQPQPIYAWAKFADYATVKLRTRRGLTLEGSVNHRVMLPDGSWRRLDELHIGEVVKISGGQNLWTQEHVYLQWQPAEALMVGASIHKGQFGSVGDDAERACTPLVVDECLAALLGYLCGAGQISAATHTISLSTDDEVLAQNFADLVGSRFGPVANWHKDDQVSCSSFEVQDLLTYLGLKSDVATREQVVPEVILRSPKPVVASFLRALYDCAGAVDATGLLLANLGERTSEVVQLLLLNFGILTHRRHEDDGTWRIQITSQNTIEFYTQIGFGLQHKQAALARFVEEWSSCGREEWTDEVVSLELGRADVYDISVEATHRYAAQGFINHNSYWHSTIMTQKVATASEIVAFADLHSGIVATGGGRLNPYKLGLELLRDVEERWNRGQFGKEYDECEDIREKKIWDRGLGLGRQKLFEIRKLYNDVTFIDEFLTPEFVVDNKLFTFRYNRDTDFYEIASREFKAIKEKLLFRLTNFGQPFIYVEDGNYNNRGELYLRHRHEGVDLKLDYARDTMRNLYKLWTRPIHLETLIDDKKRLLSFDGSDFAERRVD
ncbi:MAG: SpoVR family protein [Chloroflexales bacterium]